MTRIFLIGFMGAGKTTLGRYLAQEHGFSLIDLDNFIEETHFKTINQLFEAHGEKGFRIIERKALEEVAEMENVIIATGGGTPCFFDNMELMSSKGTTVFISVDQEELLDRLEKAKCRRPLLKDKNREEIETLINEMIKKRINYYKKANIIIDGTELNDKKSVAELAEYLLNKLGIERK